PAHYKYSVLLATTGRFGEAVSEMQKFNQYQSGGPYTPDAEGYINLALSELPKIEWRTAVAVAYAANKNRDRTLEYLEKAVASGDEELLLGIRLPTFDFIRSDPQFVDLARRMGVPP